MTTNLLILSLSLWLTNATGEPARTYWGGTNGQGFMAADYCYTANFEVLCPSNLTAVIEENWRPQDPTPWYSGNRIGGGYGMEWTAITPPLALKTGTNLIQLPVTPGDSWFYRVKQL